MEALDAFVAAIDPDGRVHTGCMADPITIPTVVAIFILDGLRFEAIYHDVQDVWEVFGEERGKDWNTRDQEYAVSRPKEAFYNCAFRTVGAFRDKLLDGPGQDYASKRLADAMKRTIMDEIDSEIIKDLLTVTELPAISIPNVMVTPEIFEPRPLKVSWTLQTTKQLPPQYIGITSRIIRDGKLLTQR